MRILATIPALAIAFSSLAALAAIPGPGSVPGAGPAALHDPTGPATLPGGALDDKMPGVWFLRDSAPCFRWTGGPVTCFGVDVGEHTGAPGNPGITAPDSPAAPGEDPAGIGL